MQGVRHTRCRAIPPGGGGLGTWSFPGAQQILHVFGDSDYATETGTMRAPFHSIGAAITEANSLTPATDNRILILVWPMEGGYDESITLADDYVYLAGVARDGCIITNDGVPVTVTADVAAVWNMTIVATDADPIVDVNGGGVELHECWLVGSGDDAERLYVRDGGTAEVHDCYLQQAAISNVVVDLDNDTSNSLTLKGCRVYGHIRVQRGDLKMYDSYVEGSNAFGSVRLVTQENVRIQNCHIVSANDSVLFLQDAPTVLEVVDNYLESATGGFYALETSAAITGAVIENNVMINGGIHEDVSHVNPNKRVGEEAVKDWYATVQEALTACTYDDCVVELYTDEVLGAALTPPSRPVTIDGRATHVLTRAAGSPVATIGASDDLVLRCLSAVGSLDVDGNGANLRLEQVDLDGMVDVVSGDSSTQVEVIMGSAILGDGTDNYALRLRDADPVIIVSHSFLKGNSGNVAVYWDTSTNNNLKAKHSTFVHGSAGGNNPFGASGAQTPNFRAHHCGFNVDPTSFAGPPNWTNLVAAGQQQNTYDVDVDWS